MAEGLDTSSIPRSVMAKTPISFTAPNLFFWHLSVLNLLSVPPSSMTEQSTQCSRTFGPASVPSFVTWPTMNVATASFFAILVNLAAHSLTWETEPGTEEIPSSYMTWIESMMSTSGRYFTTSPSTRSAEVSAAALT